MTAITSGRVTIPAWRVMRAAWFRNRMTLTVLLAAFAVAAGWMLYEAERMRSWLIAHHIQQCIIPGNGAGSACEPLVTWGQFRSSSQAYYVIFPLLGVPVVLATFGGVRWLTREYETGSFRYTWTLGVSRFRWLAGTLLPLLAVAAAGAVACGLAYDRWFPAGQWLTVGGCQRRRDVGECGGLPERFDAGLGAAFRVGAEPGGGQDWWLPARSQRRRVPRPCGSRW